MTYYRLAFQERQTPLWTWKSTGLTSLDAVLQLLRSFSSSIPPDRIRVFTSSAKEDLAEMLSRENNYTFALPLSMPQVLAWMRLLAKVQRGE